MSAIYRLPRVVVLLALAGITLLGTRVNAIFTDVTGALPGG